MGGSSKQVTGYQYFANFLLFIGNPIEKLLGINFDKRGWLNPLVDESGNALAVGIINKPSLYGENEGGVAGQIHARYGSANPVPVSFYTDYLAENELLPLAYPFQSYLALEDFYLGNSGYMKEMLLWPKRIHIKNDGTGQWYDAKAEIGTIKVTTVEGEITPFDFIALRKTVFDGVEHIDTESKHYNTENTYVAEISNFYTIGESFNSGIVTEGIITGVGSNGIVKVTGAVIQQGESNISIARIEPTSSFIQFGYSITESTVDGILYKTYEINGMAKLLSNADISVSIYLDGNGSLESISFGININIKKPKLQDEIKVDFLDINPIHKIREILTDDTAMNKPESDVNNINFMKAADRIWDEGLGVSWAITEKSCIEAINELCSHIEAGIRVNRQTGLYEMVLFRDDWFEEDEIHALAESKIKSISFEIQNADDVVNQLNVSYYDRANIKDASFSISENASIKNMQGRVNAEAADFPYFMNQRNAAVVAQWKLKQMTAPCWKGTFTTGFYEARKWNRYDIVKLNWSRKGIVDLPVRIMSINLGDGIENTVSIDFVEVVPFSDELTSSVVIDDKIDMTSLPPQPILFKAFELSYFEAVQAHGQRTVDDELAYNPDAGYVAVVAQRSQNNSLNAQMHTDAGTGYENSAVIQYCETAQLDQSIDSLASSFIVKKVGDLASVRIGSQIFINNEIMVFQGFDAASKLLTVKRGALDTIPQIHTDDSVLFFADDFVAVDSTEYAEGEAIYVKALSTTPSGILQLSGSDTQNVIIQSRATRPYPPANVKINGEYWPTEIETDLILTWVDRNRVQQTGGSILGWFDDGVTLESSVQYQLILTEFDENQIVLRTQNINVGNLNTYTFALSSTQANTRSIEITLKALRDGFECLIPYSHHVELSTFFSAPYNIAYVVSDI